jgi:hypothetical protein
MPAVRAAAWLLAVVSLTACANDLGGSRTDAALRVDASARDGAVLDATTSDAPALDAPGLDAAPLDAPAIEPDAPPVADAFVPLDGGPTCPSPGPTDCSPGPGTGKGAECYGGTSCFLRQVQNAVNGVVRDNASWFDASAGPTHVLEVEMYMDAVVAVLNAAGLCAIRDPNAGDEIVVKFDNSYAENFDILTASEDVRSGAGIYTSTCTPAWF